MNETIEELLIKHSQRITELEKQKAELLGALKRINQGLISEYPVKVEPNRVAKNMLHWNKIAAIAIKNDELMICS